MRSKARVTGSQTRALDTMMGHRGDLIVVHGGDVLRHPWRKRIEGLRGAGSLGKTLRSSPWFERKQRLAREGFNGGESTTASSRVQREVEDDGVGSVRNEGTSFCLKMKSRTRSTVDLLA